MTRTYTDVNGNNKTLKLVNEFVRFSLWKIDHPPSIIQSWEMHDGYLLHIPKDAWEVLGIKYEDKEQALTLENERPTDC